MLDIILATAPFGDVDTLAAGGLLAFFAAFAMLSIVLSIAVWVYTSFAYMAIAKKNKQSSPGLAWIPMVGPSIVSVRAAKMHWWPILLIIGMFIPLIGWIAQIAFTVFFIIWNWKMMEALKRDGWWAIFILIFPVYLVMLGIVAWSKK